MNAREAAAHYEARAREQARVWREMARAIRSANVRGVGPAEPTPYERATEEYARRLYAAARMMCKRFPGAGGAK